MSATTTIVVKTTTHQKLVRLGRKDQTFDEIINELIEQQKKESGV